MTTHTQEPEYDEPTQPLPPKAVKSQILEALNKGELDAALTLIDPPQARPTCQTVQQSLEADNITQAAEQLKALIRWEQRPRFRPVSEIRDQRPDTLLQCTGADGPLLVAGTVAILSGAGAVGKSTLATQIALQFAYNMAKESPDGLWQTTATGPVMVVMYEDDDGSTAHKMKKQAHKLDRINALAGVHLKNFAGWPLFGPPLGASYNTRPDKLDGFDALAEGADRIEPRLIIIDPALSAYVGDSNAAAPVREFVATLAELAKTHNAAVLLLAHSNKDARRGNNKKEDSDPFDAGQIAGSAQWHDAARAGLVLTRKKDNPDRWTLAVSKCNYGPSYIPGRTRAKRPRLSLCGAGEDERRKGRMEAERRPTPNY